MEDKINKFDFLIDKILNSKSREDMQEVVSTYFHAWAKTEYTKIIYNQTLDEIKQIGQKIAQLQERKNIIITHISDLKNPSRRDGVIDRKMILGLEDALRKNGLEIYNTMRELGELHFIQKRINFLSSMCHKEIFSNFLKDNIFAVVEDDELAKEMIMETRTDTDAVFQSADNYYTYLKNKGCTPPKEFDINLIEPAAIELENDLDSDNPQSKKCAAKIAYKSLHAANMATMKYYESLGVIQYSYKCPVCEFYHLTSRKGSGFDYIKTLTKNM